MSADIREYLIERFETDARTLRTRADTLASESARKPATPTPGPDAAVSRAMADACDEVVTLATQLPTRASVEEIVTALQTMLRTLATCANSATAQKFPPVRAVFAGASTRVQELIAAETRAASGHDTTATGNDANEDETDEDEG